MIELRGVHFRYGRDGPLVLQGINLMIREGEFIALVGPNGSGKSTLAEIMAGLLRPTRGELLLDGASNRSDSSGQRQGVGLVFQNPEHQFFHATVAEDVAFGPENLGLPPHEVRERVAQALMQVGMEGHEACSPRDLSAGQKQAVAIAGILAMRPRFLILDEPTSLLDPRGRRRIFRIVKELREAQGCAVIWITQEMEEAARAKRLLVMHEGRIVRDGPPMETFQDVGFLEGIGLDLPDTLKLRERLRRDGLEEMAATLDTLLEEIRGHLP